jgi:hypothetical protein
MPTDDLSEPLYVISFAIHPMQHTVAIGADRNEVFKLAHYVAAQLAEWIDMMRFGKLETEFPIAIFETQTANLAPVVVADFAFRCQQVTSLPLQV